MPNGIFLRSLVSGVESSPFAWSQVSYWENGIAYGTTSSATFDAPILNVIPIDATAGGVWASQINSLIFSSGDSTKYYRLQSGTINLSGTTPKITVNTYAEISSNLNGTVAWTVNGVGTLKLTGVSSFTGALTVTDSTILVQNSSALGALAAGNITCGATSTIRLDVPVTYSKSITLAGTLILNHTGTSTINVVTSGGSITATNNSTLSSSISGSAALTVRSSPNIPFTLQGTIASTTTALTYAPNGGTIYLRGTTNSAVNLYFGDPGYEGGVVNVQTIGTSTTAGQLCKGGSLRWSYEAPCILEYTGTGEVTSATLALQLAFSPQQMATTYSEIHVNNTSGILKFSSIALDRYTGYDVYNKLIVRGSGVLELGGAITEYKSGTTSSRFYLNKYGSGECILSGANNISGTIGILEGTVTISNANALNTNTSYCTVYFGGGILKYTVAPTYMISNYLQQFTDYSVRLDIGSLNLVDYDPSGGSVTRGGFDKYGSGTLTCTDNLGCSGVVNVYAGRLVINTYNIYSQISSGISGASSVNAYTGGVIVTTKLYALANCSVDSTGSIEVNQPDGTVANITNANSSINSINFSATTGRMTVSSISGIGYTNFGSNLTVTGSVGGGGSLRVGGTSIILNILNNINLILPTTASVQVSSGSCPTIISGSGVSVEKLSSGELTLSGTNSFGGGFILSAGTVRIGNSSALGTGSYTFNSGTVSTDGVSRTLYSPVTGIIGGNLSLGTNLTNNTTLTLSGAYSLNGSTRVLTVAAPVIFSGIVSDGGITKLGTSRLVLRGSNTFSLGLSISAGIIITVNEIATGSGPVIISSSGTLSTSTETPKLRLSGKLTMSGGTLRIGNSGY